MAADAGARVGVGGRDGIAIAIVDGGAGGGPQRLAGWVAHGATEQPYRDYRHLRKRPLDAVNAYLAVTQETS